VLYLGKVEEIFFVIVIIKKIENFPIYLKHQEKFKTVSEKNSENFRESKKTPEINQNIFSE
jgi:hypothetical protein